MKCGAFVTFIFCAAGPHLVLIDPLHFPLTKHFYVIDKGNKQTQSCPPLTFVCRAQT